jgi:hypothetical protein
MNSALGRERPANSSSGRLDQPKGMRYACDMRSHVRSESGQAEEAGVPPVREQQVFPGVLIGAPPGPAAAVLVDAQAGRCANGGAS